MRDDAVTVDNTLLPQKFSPWVAMMHRGVYSPKAPRKGVGNVHTDRRTGDNHQVVSR